MGLESLKTNQEGRSDVIQPGTKTNVFLWKV